MKINKDSFLDVYNEFKNLVKYQCLKYLRNELDVEDVEQQVWILFWRHKNSLDRKRLAGWLKRISFTASIDFIRKRNRIHKREIDGVPYEKSYEVTNLLDLNDEVKSIFSQLKRQDVDLLKRYYLDDLSLNELVDKKKMKLGTIKSKLDRIKKTARKIGEEVYT